jgi:hypothetical protein
LAEAYIQAGRPSDAAAAYRRYAELVGPEVRVLEQVARSAGDPSARAAAVATLDGITRPSWQLPATSIAVAYVRLGEHGKALGWLQRAYDGGDVALPFVFRDPAFAPVRMEPDFVALAAKMGVAVP